MEPDWLIRKLTIYEAETLNMVSDARLGPEPVPFGFINDVWQNLKSYYSNTNKFKKNKLFFDIVITALIIGLVSLVLILTK